MDIDARLSELAQITAAPTKAIELGEAIVDRVIAAGGSVEELPERGGLAKVGGIVALLRYPL